MGRLAARAILASTWLLGGLLACAHEPKPGLRHTVQPGETVWRISRRYGVSVEDVTRANGIDDVTRVRAGTRLFIPGGRDRGDAQLPPPPPASTPSGSAAPRRQSEEGLAFAWPLRGPLTSGFGRRRGRPHEGIDIAAPRGSLVRAAEAGRVIHAGTGLGAYGRVVIIKHVGSYSSVYAHNRRLRVRKGQFVERGEPIAEVGTSGNATGPHLHFEIRYGDRPRNPLRLLPRPTAVAKRK